MLDIASQFFPKLAELAISIFEVGLIGASAYAFVAAISYIFGKAKELVSK